ncbi:MAG: tellurite resistance/C4-dicarboxylate transporter family protein [Porticoccaceae bacterium]
MLTDNKPRFGLDAGTSPTPANSGLLAMLSPASFGIVMATGIVSLACALLGLPLVGRWLFALNVLLYVVVWALNLARLLRYPQNMCSDACDHGRAPGFFTVVAASGVLGGQCLLLADARVPALWLAAVALVLWVILSYGIFAAVMVKRDKPRLEHGLGGGWLLAVVATQSLVGLGALLAPGMDASWQAPLALGLLGLWLWGGVLYTLLISLIFYRIIFLPLSPTDLAPPYWINMGAMAISTLAGTLLLQQGHDWPLLQNLKPFVQGLTLLFWAGGSWWIPLLLVLGVWRHALQRHPLRYEGLYWAMVFPLGMYAVATHRLALALEQPWLQPLAQTFMWVGLGAWVLAALGLAGTLGQVLSRYLGR